MRKKKVNVSIQERPKLETNFSFIPRFHQLYSKICSSFSNFISWLFGQVPNLSCIYTIQRAEVEKIFFKKKKLSHSISHDLQSRDGAVLTVKIGDSRSSPEPLIKLVLHLIRHEWGPTERASLLIMVHPTV